MKTRNNTQETVKGQVRKMVLRGSAVIFGLVLISLTTVSAQDFWNLFLSKNTYGKMAMLMIKQSSENEKADVAFDAINAELEAQTNIEYNASDFVKAELAAETETNTDAVEAELELQSEAWMNTIEYNASDFVEAELAAETETNTNAVEAELELQSEVLMNNSEYHAENFVEAEMALEIESGNKSNIETDNEVAEAELSLQVEVLMNNIEYHAENFVEAEMALEIEGGNKSNVETDNEVAEAESSLQVEVWMNNIEYHAEKFAEAEITFEIESGKYSNVDTVNEVIEAEPALQIEAWMNNIEYHAEKFVEAEIAFEIESWITNENYIKSAETLTALGTDQEIEKYAEKQILFQKNKPIEQSFKTKICNETTIAEGAEPVLEIEDWMTNENYFKSAETLTARGTDQEIEKYAEKQIFRQNRNRK